MEILSKLNQTARRMINKSAATASNCQYAKFLSLGPVTTVVKWVGYFIWIQFPASNFKTFKIKILSKFNQTALDYFYILKG